MLRQGVRWRGSSVALRGQCRSLNPVPVSGLTSCSLPASASRVLFSTSRLNSASKQGNQSSGDPEKTPFQVFVDTFRSEWSKSKELQDNIKALQDETGRMSESAAFKRAKEASEKAKSGLSSASSITGKGIRKAGEVVGSAASTAWDSPLMKVTRNTVNHTADTVEKATEPIRKTEFYKNVKEVIDDGSSVRYGGFEDKETRRKRRELEEKKRHIVHIKSNPEAGQSVVIHATAKPEKSWAKSGGLEKTALGKKLANLKVMYEESENGFISSIRSVTDKLGSLFEETEYARVIKMFKEMDPSFSTEYFLRDVNQYILPEVLDAYVKGDPDTLKLWLSEAPFNVWHTSVKDYQKQGIYSAGRVLDIRGVDILNTKLLSPADIPVIVISCRAQELHVYKKLKTDEIVAGSNDHIQMVTYAMVLTRVPEEMDNRETRGWKILELARAQSRDYT